MQNHRSRGSIGTVVLLAIFAIWFLPHIVDSVLAAFDSAVPYILGTLAVVAVVAIVAVLAIRYMRSRDRY